MRYNTIVHLFLFIYTTRRYIIIQRDDFNLTLLCWIAPLFYINLHHLYVRQNNVASLFYYNFLYLRRLLIILCTRREPIENTRLIISIKWNPIGYVNLICV